MDIRLATSDLATMTGDVLIIGIGPGDAMLTGIAGQVDQALAGLIKEARASGEIKGTRGELTTFHSAGKLAIRRILVAGLGKQEAQDAQTVQRASAIAARHAQETGARQIVLALSTTPSGIQAQAEGALLGLYTFTKYKTEGKATTSVECIEISGQGSEAAEALRQGQIMAEGANLTRDLVNEPCNTLTPTEFALRASRMAERFGLESEVLDAAQMKQMGMGGVLGVAQGSSQPPRFIILRHQGAPDSPEKGLALVGKGITFDSGGLSIKTAEGMITMKGDMGGGAAVIGAMQIIAQLKPAINVTALVPATENMPDGNAFRPGDVLRILNGKTIEIVNTDAEGRLVLADALSYAAQKGLSPIIDVATLTGGVVVALGSVTSGIFTNDPTLGEAIYAAGQAKGEKFWAMPMDEEYAEQIKSDIADIKQTGGRLASAITAAKILEQFVGEARWAHLDIAGTSYLDSKRPYQEKGSTGVAARTLAEFVLRQAQDAQA